MSIFSIDEDMKVIDILSHECKSFDNMTYSEVLDKIIVKRGGD